MNYLYSGQNQHKLTSQLNHQPFLNSVVPIRKNQLLLTLQAFPSLKHRCYFGQRSEAVKAKAMAMQGGDPCFGDQRQVPKNLRQWPPLLQVMASKHVDAFLLHPFFEGFLPPRFDLFFLMMACWLLGSWSMPYHSKIIYISLCERGDWQTRSKSRLQERGR